VNGAASMAGRRTDKSLYELGFLPMAKPSRANFLAKIRNP
jgi:hypothetical protein